MQFSNAGAFSLSCCSGPELPDAEREITTRGWRRQGFTGSEEVSEDEEPFGCSTTRQSCEMSLAEVITSTDEKSSDHLHAELVSAKQAVLDAATELVMSENECEILRTEILELRRKLEIERRCRNVHTELNGDEVALAQLHLKDTEMKTARLLAQQEIISLQAQIKQLQRELDAQGVCKTAPETVDGEPEMTTAESALRGKLLAEEECDYLRAQIRQLQNELEMERSSKTVRKDLPAPVSELESSKASSQESPENQDQSHHLAAVAAVVDSQRMRQNDCQDVTVLCGQAAILLAGIAALVCGSHGLH
eukprot:gnl/MRDRNA2_/MRDRNA2_15626_c0_seq1.p1 gnl/MRDRNA2_/MRDRNA2_15626_c0~~gnl/MRDRNA2_/MRDRNA2_15626_c0_seq1.p1  ORF type:complete len:307 (-),score=81.73 gnl/MRDRNA2_/MRDRNA2_15626_c0_seq1:6-926(-)